MPSFIDCVCLILVTIVFFLADVDSHPQTQLKENINETKEHFNSVNVVTSSGRHHKKHLFFIPFVVPYKTDLAINSSEGAPLDEEDDFPFFLSVEQLLHGGIILVIIIGLYGFSLLAVVCNDYFIPCVETICEKVNVTPDVAAATFMSIATSTPEFFTNIVGTFITKSDLGIGTIVGSSLCNALLVPAIGGLNSPYPLQLDWYPLSRDCIIYILSVSVLIEITWDGKIYWYETFIPLTVYVIYFVIMFNNKRIAKFVKSKLSKTYTEEKNMASNNNITETDNQQNSKKISIVPEDISNESILSMKKQSIMSAPKLSILSAPKQSILSAYGSYLKNPEDPEFEIEHKKVLEAIKQAENIEAKKSMFKKPEGNWFWKFLFYYTWPIKMILRCSIPNPVIYPKWFPVTFLMCIFWIGVNSYVVSWMISLIGDVTKLPDALLGMTLIAVGGCLPETVSMTIIARRGEGAFGVSNSLGANTMNVLYSLGLPWLFKNIFNGMSSVYPVVIQSGSIEYSIMSLIVAVSILYLTLLIGKFKLSKISGGVLGFFYACLVGLAVLSQILIKKN